MFGYFDNFNAAHDTHHQPTMSACQKAARPLTRCLQNSQVSCHSTRAIRTLSSSSRTGNEVATETASYKVAFDPATTTTPKGERALMKAGITPIGSRRRRAAIRTSDNIPFEQLPYQCFQEARKVLQADREEKLKLIQTERLRISNLMAQDASTVSGGEIQKQRRLDSMRRHLEYLKIQADINDPMIKKRFEDGEGKCSFKFDAGFQMLMNFQEICPNPSTATWQTGNGDHTND